MPTEPNDAKSVFLHAVELTSHSDRAAYLDRMCQGQPEMRRRIEALLRCSDQPDELLDQPLIGRAIPGERCGATTETTTPNDPDVGADLLGFLDPSAKPGRLGRIGHYEAIEVIGRGGMGVVLKAEDMKLRRVVAIKVLAPAFAADAVARKRFLREAQAAAAVSHDHVVRIHAVEDEHRLPFLVMECIEGQSLQQKLDRVGPLDVPEILRIALQIAEGLAAAHRQGLVHRDIKPANILLENGIERVKITDFGLARAKADVAVTQSGVVAGTPLYMSPEQALGIPIDHRSDLFSLGSVMYAMCTGRVAFRADSPVAILRRVCDDTPRPIRDLNEAMPTELVEVIDRLMAKKPNERFATAREVCDVLAAQLAILQRPTNPGTPLANPVARPTSAEQPSPARPPSRGRTELSLAARYRVLWAGVALVAAIAGTELTGVTQLIPNSMAPWRGGGRPGAPIQSHPNSAAIETPADRAVAAPGTGDVTASRETSAETAGNPPARPVIAPREVNLAAALSPAAAAEVARHIAALDRDARLPMPAMPAIDDAAGWLPLFNGVDLTGWNPVAGEPGGQAKWSVADGVLTGSGDQRGFLFTERSDFQDFHLRAVVRLAASSDSGLFVRSRRGELHHGQFYEVQLANTPNKDKTGGLWNRVPEMRQLVEPGEWFLIELLARGSHLRVLVNGRTTLDYTDLDPARPLTGHIGLQVQPRTTVEFRRIELREFPGLKLLKLPAMESQAQAAQRACAEQLHTATSETIELGTADRPRPLELRLIPPGEFRMSNRLDAAISRPFWMATTETTVGQFRAFVEQTGYRTEPETSGQGSVKRIDGTDVRKPEYIWSHADFAPSDEHPVVQVTWNDAVRFCEWLSRRSGRVFRLPTEAEWEWACRAGSADRFSFGDDPSRMPDYGWFAGNSGGHTQPVGQKLPNAWGLRDMHGNAVEWCFDRHVPELPLGRQVDPVAADNTSVQRTSRGGGYIDSELATSATSRPNLSHNRTMFHWGFRVLCEVGTSQVRSDHPVFSRATIRPELLHRVAAEVPDALPELIGVLELPQGPSGAANDLAFSPDGRLLATAGLHGSVTFWDMERGTLRANAHGHTQHARCLAFSPDSQWLATSGFDRTIRLWNCRTFECERIIDQRQSIEGLAFSPDGRWLASAGRAGTASIHDVATGAEVVTSPHVADSLLGVAFSPDQRLLLTSASDTFVRLHDVETGRETQRLIGHTRSGSHVAFHPSGRSTISASHDGTVRQWNLQTGQTHRLLSVRGRLFHGLRWSPDLQRAALGGTNGSLVIWDLAAEPPTARLLALFPSARADQWLHCGAFSPDGRQLATANPDGTIYLLKLNPPAAALRGP